MTVKTSTPPQSPESTTSKDLRINMKVLKDLGVPFVLSNKAKIWSKTFRSFFKT